ncbi:hypothetical protein BJX99DRAFT_234845 [Aspergillus californicus]
MPIVLAAPRITNYDFLRLIYPSIGYLIYTVIDDIATYLLISYVFQNRSRLRSSAVSSPDLMMVNVPRNHHQLLPFSTTQRVRMDDIITPYFL